MKKINNNHGFTLVELLAVIVVLAIVMLVAVQSVLPQMEKARRQTLALDAQTAIESANTFFMNMSLSKPEKGFPTATGISNGRCISIDILKSEGYYSTKGNYEGSVLVYKEGSNYFFKVWLMKDQLMIPGAGSKTENSKTENIQIRAGESSTDTFNLGENDVVPASGATIDGQSKSWTAINGGSCGGQGTSITLP